VSVRPLTQQGGSAPVAWGKQCVYNASLSPSARRASDVFVAIRREQEHALASPRPEGEAHVLLRWATWGRRAAEHIPHGAK